MNKIRCLIVEDEVLAQKVIVLYLRKYPEFEIVQCCKTAEEAYDVMQRQKIDLLFLDIQLPGTSGTELVTALTAPPKIIFTTAYSEYAAVSYELDAVDYLVKPFSADRFEIGLHKFLQKSSRELATGDIPAFIFLKVGHELTKVFFSDIMYLEARKDYVRVWEPNRTYLTLMRMKTIEERLPADLFLRIHRSYIINRSFVNRVGLNHVTINHKVLLIGETYKESVLKALYKIQQ